MTGELRLAVLGDPLRYTRSPDLHRAGALALGYACESVAIRTAPEELPATLARLEAEGYVGCNLTMPHKEAALALVREATPAAKRARSVNTISFRGSGLHGDTTDGIGFLDLLASLDRTPARDPVVLLGAGGSARSLAAALLDASAQVNVISRSEPAPGPAWTGSAWHAWGSGPAFEAIAQARVIVNCTPLSGDTAPLELQHVAQGSLLIDLTYGESLTPWVAQARSRGFEAVDGLGLLVHQARHSLSRWFGREVPFAPLAAAVGWPR
ncbi:MAG: shikimate dehydrogenase [Candidatus Eisenbacteria bacterium]|nr:shikimate dehydrogenase [Candidatus Eisenbacteria bacterium]